MLPSRRADIAHLGEARAALHGLTLCDRLGVGLRGRQRLQTWRETVRWPRPPRRGTRVSISTLTPQRSHSCLRVIRAFRGPLGGLGRHSVYATFRRVDRAAPAGQRGVMPAESATHQLSDRATDFGAAGVGNFETPFAIPAATGLCSVGPEPVHSVGCCRPSTGRRSGCRFPLKTQPGQAIGRFRGRSGSGVRSSRPPPVGRSITASWWFSSVAEHLMWAGSSRGGGRLSSFPGISRRHRRRVAAMRRSAAVGTSSRRPTRIGVTPLRSAAGGIHRRLA